MNNIYANDKNLKTDEEYNNFLEENSGIGHLKIRAFSANQAIPVSNLKIIVTKNIGNKRIIFFEGTTDSSGVINDINLPAPKINTNNEVIPKTTSYDINAINKNNSFIYQADMYDNICVVQNINIVPNINIG